MGFEIICFNVMEEKKIIPHCSNTTSSSFHKYDLKVGVFTTNIAISTFSIVVILTTVNNCKIPNYKQKLNFPVNTKFVTFKVPV